MITKYCAKFYIEKETLEIATRKDCPDVFNSYIEDILMEVMKLNGLPLELYKKDNLYKLEYMNPNDKNIYTKTLTEEEILEILKDKEIKCEITVEDAW